ncbi:hypothetical protein BGW38_000435 [Lunasporangiospora selenospora]|uniref:Peptidase family S41 n=1 Tax=Lunasporangiospora selenospora TaxID=979761 RepID=A0A9P6KET9_9FUNG|nr:hypothetical protein BGW38_000435 [Lunasporangiospora selenospora]
MLAAVAENLILDLSHSPGWYICMGDVLLKILFPEDVPFVTNLRLTPLVREQLADRRLGVSSLFNPYGYPPDNSYWSGSYLQEKSHPDRDYSFSNFVLDICPKDRFKPSMDPSVEANRKRTTPQTDAASYRPWDPENLAILTDGYCGSTCALISNTLRYKYDVPAVVVGGKSLASEERMSYSTFPGLHVVDNAYVFRSIGSLRGDTDDAALGHQEEGDFKEAKEPLPKAFGHKARQRMTYRQIYYTGRTKDQFSYKDGQHSPA